MKTLFSICIIIFVLCCFPFSPRANDAFEINGIYYISSGSYFIEEDEKGAYLKIDKGFFWYLDEEDSSVFKPGESGLYFMNTEENKPYILTDKNRAIYVGQDVAKLFNNGEKNSERFFEPVEVIKGDENFFANGLGGEFVTKEEAQRGIKGRATLDWEKRKEEEKAQKLEEEQARERAEEAAINRMIMIRALEEARRARTEAEITRQEAEAARQQQMEEIRRRSAEAFAIGIHGHGR